MGKTQEREKHYWGYRIDVKNQDFFFKELEQGRLRQGWGYDKNQELPDTKDSGAKKNLSMYKNVKKGDILDIKYFNKNIKVRIKELPPENLKKDFIDEYIEIIN